MQRYRPDKSLWYKVPPKSKGTLELEEIIGNKPLSDLTEEQLNMLRKLGYKRVEEDKPSFYKLIRIE